MIRTPSITWLTSPSHKLYSFRAWLVGTSNSVLMENLITYSQRASGAVSGYVDVPILPLLQ